MKIETLKQRIEELTKPKEDTGFERGFNCGVKCALMFIEAYEELAEVEEFMIMNTKIRNMKERKEYPLGRNDYQE
jgi:hypothetical protein